MDLNKQALKDLFTAYSAAYQQGFDSLEAGSQYEQFCMLVNSTAAIEAYPWLKQLPNMREWLGDRVIHQLEGAKFEVANKKFELTAAVERDAIEDDSYGLYKPIMQELGRSARAHPNELIAKMLADNVLKGMDGQPLFSESHVVINDKGRDTTTSNMLKTGSTEKTAWYVMDLSRTIKPMIFQKRRDYQFRAINDINDDGVFLTDKFLYGVDARVAVAPGFWQLIVRSTKDLTAANYAEARAKLQNLKGDYGRPLGITHTHTMVPVSLEADALKVLNADLKEGSVSTESNIWKGTSKLIVNPWL